MLRLHGGTQACAGRENLWLSYEGTVSANGTKGRFPSRAGGELWFSRSRDRKSRLGQVLTEGREFRFNHRRGLGTGASLPSPQVGGEMRLHAAYDTLPCSGHPPSGVECSPPRAGACLLLAKVGNTFFFPMRIKVKFTTLY